MTTTTTKPDLSIWNYTKSGNTIELTGIKPRNVDALIVPTNADFEGIETVYITAKVMHDAYKRTTNTFTISQTKGGVLTAKDANWAGVFSNHTAKLTLDHFDTGNITTMNYMFYESNISNLTPLSHWDLSNVTAMSYMFYKSNISDLTPLSHWDLSNVTHVNNMFAHNQISDLSPLAKWNVSHIITMSAMFRDNNISDLTPLSNWDIDNVKYDKYMFEGNSIQLTKLLRHQ